MTPLTMLILISFFVAFAVLDNPDGTLAHVTSFIPFCAPIDDAAADRARRGVRRRRSSPRSRSRRGRRGCSIPLAGADLQRRGAAHRARRSSCATPGAPPRAAPRSPSWTWRGGRRASSTASSAAAHSASTGSHPPASASAASGSRRPLFVARLARREQQLDVRELRADRDRHRVEDLGALVDRGRGAGELLLDAQDVAHRAAWRARSPRGSRRRRRRRPRRAPSARAPGRACRRPRARAWSRPRGRSRRRACRRRTRAARASSPGCAPRRGRRARRSRRCARCGRGRAPRPPWAWRAARPWPRRRCARAPGRCSPRCHDDVAGLARRALDVADRVAVVALADGDLVERRRRRPPRTSGPSRCRARPRARRPRPSPSPRAPLELQAQALDRLVHLLQAGVVLVGALLDHRQRRALVDRERVVVGVGGELLAQVLADLHGGLGEHRLDAVLDRDRRVVAEVAGERAAHVPVVGAESLVELLVEPLGDLARALDELRVELAGALLELRLDELDVRARLLAMSTRAPISIASPTTRAGSSPAVSRARTSSTAVGSSTASPSTSTRLASTVTRGWRRGVAASIEERRNICATT